MEKDNISDKQDQSSEKENQPITKQAIQNVEVQLPEQNIASHQLNNEQPQNPQTQTQVQFHAFADHTYQQIKLKITCPRCYYTYSSIREPYVLPCGHTMCNDCIGYTYNNYTNVFQPKACLIFNCQVPIGQGVLQKDQAVDALVKKLNADYYHFSELIDTLLQQEQLKGDIHIPVIPNTNNTQIEVDQEDERERLAKGILMSAFSYDEICNALHKAAKILARRSPPRALNYYWQHINLVNQNVPWNLIDNRNASNGSDLFAIGKILQTMGNLTQAVKMFKWAIRVFFDCDSDLVWQKHFYWPEVIIEDLQEGIVVIDHVTNLHKEKVGQGSAEEMIQLQESKLVFLKKFERMIDQFRNSNIRQGERPYHTKDYLYHKAAVCMLISNIYRNQNNKEQSSKFKQMSHDIIWDENDMENCNEVECIDKIRIILKRLINIEQATSNHDEQSGHSIVSEGEGQAGTEEESLFHEIKQLLISSLGQYQQTVSNEKNIQIQHLNC